MFLDELQLRLNYIFHLLRDLHTGIQKAAAYCKKGHIAAGGIFPGGIFQGLILLLRGRQHTLVELLQFIAQVILLRAF